MSDKTKAGAYRRGYLKALKDVEFECERLQCTVGFVLEVGSIAETNELRAGKKVLQRLRFDVLCLLRKGAGS